ncbi:MAG: tRNA (adenosine(37)-N6)-dimethylallyltransferase MiaA [Chloroflexi bacterium]|nr:tRNA (adenosine(37)-N6)-dimethylallyltransferase MiaA [Chloroflexota bacterium]
MSPEGQDKVLAIVGPTASGKSRLGMEIAQSVGGEIVGADSRQVYRRMDIGTAKPSVEDRQRVPHHLIDIIDPSDEYSVALYVRQARQAISDVLNRDGVPIVVGGTGQYVWALLEGWNVPEISPDHLLREELQGRLSRNGLGDLVDELRRVAPVTAERVDLANPRRVMRALEVALQTTVGEPSKPTRTPPPFQATIVGSEMERTRLYDRINARVDAMFKAGWVGEVRRLLDMGFGPELPAMSSLGYREIAEYLNGDRTREDAIHAIKGKTRRFARQQGTWFRARDERIQWFPNVPGSLGEVVEYVSRSMGRRMNLR